MKRIESLSEAGPYDVLLIDPPWPYYGDGKKMGAAAKEYSLMSLPEICALPIPSLLSKNGAVFLWATGPKLQMAFSAIAAWGLHYRNVAFLWVKTTNAGTVINGQGAPATFTKQNAEYVLFATVRPAGRPYPGVPQNLPQVVLHPRIYEGGAIKHSAKPKTFRQLIVKGTPGSRRLEMFARRAPTKAWDVWGDEAINAKIEKTS